MFLVVFVALTLSGDGGAFPHLVTKGENVAMIAETIYGRVELERVIVAANGLDQRGNSAIIPGMRLEIPAVGYVSWYVLVGSVLPVHALAVEVGDSFPAYALENQDGALQQLTALEKRPPALYIFYRGHW